MSKEYKLSATLFGHSLDVRSIAVTTSNDIVSGSRDKTAKYWKFNSLTSSHQEVMTYRDQKNFVGSVLYLEPSEEYPDGLIVTGGNDNIILVYKPAEPFATFSFKEHTNAVSCLAKCDETNQFLSGSWDTSVKLWNVSNIKGSLVTFSGHIAAVWSVVQLQDKRVITASADKTIGVWSATGQRLNSIIGHTDCVRCLADFPEQNCFMSVSNDASIRVWSYNGENLDTYYGHSNFIYSIARCKAIGATGFVTSDEDRTIRVWENGKNTQIIHLPAQSVWSVACLSNGDIISGSSDGLLRVFTRDEARVADEPTLTKFTEEVNAVLRQSMQEIGGYKVSDLPGKEALYDPGKTPGQNKMIRDEGGVVLYTWVEDGDNSHWEKVGEVLGGTDKEDSGKTKFEGKSYDFVFTVDVEDGKPPLKLPYNKGEDPYVAAQAFLNKNMLPAEYLEQVVDFILKNSKEQYIPPNTQYADPFTGSSRYTPSAYNARQGAAGMNLDPLTGASSYSTAVGNSTPASSVAAGANADPFTGNSSYTTMRSTEQQFFPQSSYRTFDMGDPAVVLNKLKEFNKKVGSAVGDCTLEKLISIWSEAVMDDSLFHVLFKMLEWPEAYVFPVLDVVRMAVKHKPNNEKLAQTVLLDKLKQFLSVDNRIENNTIVSLRTICNLCVHEPGEDLIYNNRFELMESITGLGQLNKSGQVALATVLLNMTVLTVRRADELGYSILAEVLPDILTKLTDLEAQFRAYVALGTLVVSAKSHASEVKVKVNENQSFMSSLQLHLLSGQSDLENKRANCARQVRNIL